MQKSNAQTSSHCFIGLPWSRKNDRFKSHSQQSGRKKVAVIVNDMSEINIDAAIVQKEISLSRSEEKLVEMSNGCICCTLREDLLEEVTKLAKEKRFDYLVIESTGISEPLPVAETFTFADENGTSLSDVASLDTMVTVVDAINFLKDYEEAKDLQETGESLEEDDQRSVADLLVEQVEFADVILISKTDIAKATEVDRLTAILKTLNTRAKILPIYQGQVGVKQVLDTGKFSFEEAQKAPGWLKEMRGEHVPETEEYGIGSFVYEARRPFNPEKFYQFLHSTEQFGKLIRSKGYFWLATRPRFAGQWSQAGNCPLWLWRNVLDGCAKDNWPKDPDSLSAIDQLWVEPFGDMRQELVFIGQNLDKDSMTAALNNCLLSEEEVLKGKDHWINLPDPFPEWEQLSESA